MFISLICFNRTTTHNPTDDDGIVAEGLFHDGEMDADDEGEDDGNAEDAMSYTGNAQQVGYDGLDGGGYQHDMRDTASVH